MAPGDENQLDVIPSLMDVLKEAVDDARNDRGIGIKLINEEIGALIGKGERQVRGYLDKGDDDRWPTAKEIEPLVAAVAVETDSDRLELWERAISRVRTKLDEDGTDPRLGTLRALREARRAARD